eukprot:1160513-Pelagomonas_calceolata.AAC.6
MEATVRGHLVHGHVQLHVAHDVRGRAARGLQLLRVRMTCEVASACQRCMLQECMTCNVTARGLQLLQKCTHVCGYYASASQGRAGPSWTPGRAAQLIQCTPWGALCTQCQHPCAAAMMPCLSVSAAKLQQEPSLAHELIFCLCSTLEAALVEDALCRTILDGIKTIFSPNFSQHFQRGRFGRANQPARNLSVTPRGKPCTPSLGSLFTLFAVLIAHWRTL